MHRECGFAAVAAPIPVYRWDLSKSLKPSDAGRLRDKVTTERSPVARAARAAIGARVTIHAAGVKQFHEVQGGGSYLSQNDLRLHFGLGSATKMESVEIRWPNGATETLQNVPADAIYTIVEGSGIRETKPLPPPGVAPALGGVH